MLNDMENLVENLQQFSHLSVLFRDGFSLKEISFLLLMGSKSNKNTSQFLCFILWHAASEGWLEMNNILSKDFRILVSFPHNFIRFFFYLFQLFQRKKNSEEGWKDIFRWVIVGVFSKKIKTETRFISEATPGFLWAQTELKNNFILNKDTHTLLLHFSQVLGQRG